MGTSNEFIFGEKTSRLTQLALERLIKLAPRTIAAITATDDDVMTVCPTKTATLKNDRSVLAPELYRREARRNDR